LHKKEALKIIIKIKINYLENVYAPESNSGFTNSIGLSV
jgi:hypothetical protein